MKKISVLLLISFLHSNHCLAIRPSRTYVRTPANLGIAYDSLNLSTVDHYRLTAWLCHPPKQKASKIIVLASQDAGNMADNLDLVKAMTDALPVDVLMFDYRGFGTSDKILYDTRFDCRGYSLKSEGIDTDVIALPQFAVDVNSALAVLKKKNIPNKDIILYGRSLGASLALAYLENAISGTAGGIIAESPYVTQKGLKAYYLKEYKRTGSKRKVKIINSEKLEPLQYARKLNCPILLIHGQREKSVSNKEIQSLYNAIGSEKKTLWIVQNADHMQVPFVQTDAFLYQVYALINN